MCNDAVENNPYNLEYVPDYSLSLINKNSAYTMSFIVSEEKDWVAQYKKIWNEVESQLFEKMVTEPIRREGRYINGKLKSWKKHMETNFHDQDVPYDMY